MQFERRNIIELIIIDTRNEELFNICMESNEHNRQPVNPGKPDIPKNLGWKKKITSASQINTIGGFTEVIPGEFAVDEAEAKEEAVNKGLKVKRY
jgi:hypothetical protein